MENTYGNDTKDIRVHHSLVKSRFGAVPKLGQTRFEILHGCLEFTASEIRSMSSLLITAARRYTHLFTKASFLEKVGIVTIDESLIGYQPSDEAKKREDANGNPIPVVFIPRKPHPNGLIFYTVCSYLPNPLYSKKYREQDPLWIKKKKTKKFRNHFLPVIVDFFPHVTCNDISPHGLHRPVGLTGSQAPHCHRCRLWIYEPVG
jgi:hypothetical protein